MRELPLPSRVSFSRARFFLCPLLASACYAGYVCSTPHGWVFVGGYWKLAIQRFRWKSVPIGLCLRLGNRFFPLRSGSNFLFNPWNKHRLADRADFKQVINALSFGIEIFYSPILGLDRQVEDPLHFRLNQKLCTLGAWFSRHENLAILQDTLVCH